MVPTFVVRGLGTRDWDVDLMDLVLLAMDSVAVRSRSAEILNQGGFSVSEVEAGGDVLLRVRTLRPHVAVLDGDVAARDDFELCRALAALEAPVRLPFVVVTDGAANAMIGKALAAGADECVDQGLLSELLSHRVERLARARRMTDAVVLNEQLAQVGRLVAGIVHEIRGPLTVIRGNSELLNLRLGTDAEVGCWIEPILRNTLVLQRRLEHLMATVRSGPPLLTRQDLTILVREAADLFLHSLDPHQARIKLMTEFSPNLPAIMADGGRVIQVFINLFRNALDALAGAAHEGQILVRAEPCEGESERAAVKISVTDNGPGIPPVFLNRITEPFFTTKPQGTGYGLYLASEIIREHGDRLSVANAPEGGASFTFRLPRDLL